MIAPVVALLGIYILIAAAAAGRHFTHTRGHWLVVVSLAAATGLAALKSLHVISSAPCTRLHVEDFR